MIKFKIVLLCAFVFSIAGAQQLNKQNSSSKENKKVAAKSFSDPYGEGLVKKPMEIKGQARNLSMLLTLKNNKDKIKFVEPRSDYRPEILKTNYWALITTRL